MHIWLQNTSKQGRPQCFVLDAYWDNISICKMVNLKSFKGWTGSEKSPTHCLQPVGGSLFLSSPTQLSLKHSDLQSFNAVSAVITEENSDKGRLHQSLYDPNVSLWL